MWIATWWRKDPHASGTLDGYCRRTWGCAQLHAFQRSKHFAWGDWPWTGNHGVPTSLTPPVTNFPLKLLVRWCLSYLDKVRGDCSPRPVGLVERGSRCEAPSRRSRDQLFLLEWVKFIWAVDSSHLAHLAASKDSISWSAMSGSPDVSYSSSSALTLRLCMVCIWHCIPLERLSELL